MRLAVVDASIRVYRPEDREAVVDLALRAWTPVFASMRGVTGDEIDQLLHGDDWRVYQRQSVEGALDNEAMHLWVAEDPGAERVVVAFLAVTLHRDDAMGQIWMLAVDPDAQGRGLGTTLTNFATDWMREAGMRLAMIGTGGDPGHASARRAYEKAGYTAMPTVQYLKALRPTAPELGAS
jgi:GNAT superfamily N-acetyltransferase